MEEKLPASLGEVRYEVSDLVEAEGWLPIADVSTDPDDDEQRPETD